MNYWAEIIDECETIGSSKILLEHNFIETTSMSELIEVIGPVTDLLRGRMLAFVDRYGHEDVSELGEKMARSRDVMVQIFAEVKEAERWLLAN